MGSPARATSSMQPIGYPPPSASRSGWIRAMFRLPRNGVAAIFVILYWWPLALTIALYALPFIAIYKLFHVGLRREMPDRRAIVRWSSLIAVFAAVYAVSLSVFGVAGDNAVLTIAIWTAGVAATVPLVLLLRRHLARPRVMTSREVSRYSLVPSQAPDFLSWPTFTPSPGL